MTFKKQKEKDRRRARKLADEAWQAVESDNLDLAEKIIRRAVLTQLENPVLWHDQGMILALRQKDREAEDSFRAALRLAPTYADAFAQFAALRARLGYLDHAIALQTQAVQHAPNAAGFAERLQAYQALADTRPAPEPSEEAEVVVAVPTASPADAAVPAIDWSTRLAALDWESLGETLTRDGCVLIPRLMDSASCVALRGLFEQEELFAKTVQMDQPDFGRGVYRYFQEPLPEIVIGLRRALYLPVARIANLWQELLGEPERYPAQWDGFRDECRAAGQTVPTPILLKYGPGGFNALHRDLRGRVFFPIQLAVVLSPRVEEAIEGEEGFQGGAFVLGDVPEGKKSRRREIAAGLGDAILFCTRDRLVAVGGAYGLQPVKHGVTEITAGTRVVLGVPFHDYR